MDLDEPTSVPSPFSNPASRITDVIPANFLCDTQALAKVAESKLLDEKELLTLDEELSVLETRQKGLKNQVAIVEQLIADTVAKQARLRSSIATHTTLLSSSPLRALPDEVLSEIFLHYMGLFPPATRDVFKDIVVCHRILSPLLQVCRRWRKTALADPRLWTTIPLVGSGHRYRRFAHPLISGTSEQRNASWQALEDWIARSSALPLTILFHMAAKCKLGDPAYAFETFIRLFPRAKTISLYLFPLELDIPALTSVMANAEFSPALRVHTASIEIDDEGLRRKILSAIPNVEILEIGAVNIGVWLLDAPNVGDHLRSLQVHSTGLRLVEVLDLLDRVPLLETLKLFRISEPVAGDNLRVVIHAALSTFQIDVVSQQENDVIFQHLTFPSLHSLSCAAQRSWEVQFKWPRQSNINFLQRSRCALTELSFRHCNVDEMLLLEMLQSQKDLTTLQLNAFDGPKCFFDHIPIPIPMSILDFLSTKPRGMSKRPVPAVDAIRLVILPRQFKRVKRLVQSRSGDQARSDGVAELRMVDILASMQQLPTSEKQAEHAALFEEFVNEGMNIQISYHF